jgi:putative membrane protein
MSGRFTFALAAAVIAAAPPAFAHSQAAPPTAWTFEPTVVIPFALTAALFVAGAVRRRSKSDWSNAQFVLFIAGWLTLVIALISPVHKLGSELFSVHMTQHELLMIVAAPLLVLSRPVLWFLWALPPGFRAAVGQWTKRPRVAALWTAMTLPLFVWLLHGATLWAWHIPSLYQASVELEWVHALQHTSFLLTALLFWWTLLHGRHGRLSYGMGVIYCFTTVVHTSILGALMTFAQRVWYPIYDGRTTAFHVTALEDQQIGGLIMWVPAGIVFIVLGLWLLAALIRQSQNRVRYTAVEQLAAGGGRGA